MKIQFLAGEYSVCRLRSVDGIDLSAEYLFFMRTPEEISLVCETRLKPKDVEKASDGWRAFRIVGVLDFSLVGILSSITCALAANGISVFAVSTYDTDYILVKSEKVDAACEALRGAGYEVIE